MATQAQLRQRVRNNLYSLGPQSRPARQRLNGAILAADLAVTVDDATQINPGMVIEFQDDGERAYVESIATNTLTVIRGDGETTPANHADNVEIFIEPVWTIQEIDDALNEVLLELSGAFGVYHLGTTSITLVAGQDLYELSVTDVYQPAGALSVFYQESSDLELVGLPFHNRLDPASAVLSGTNTAAILLIDWGNNASGDSLEVVYAAEFDELADSDNEPLIERALVAGATASLLMGQEGARLHDPGRFTDRTVQPGQPLRDGAFYQGLYERSIRRYAAYMRTRIRNLPGQRWRRARRFVQR